jgi:hypothetical protein
MVILCWHDGIACLYSPHISATPCHIPHQHWPGDARMQPWPRSPQPPPPPTSDIYQPLMLMELLSRSSPAPAEDIARRILGEDVTQIEYYTERVKRIVGRVLTGNGITEVQQGRYRLIGGVAARLLRSR